MSRYLFAGYAVSWMLLACSGTQPPQSIQELKELTDGGRSELAEKEAPGAWAEGKRYLAMAGEAAKARNSKKADRFARLGIIQIKIALATAEQTIARMQLDDSLKKKDALAEDLESTEAAIDLLEAEQERERIRRHLESVVDTTRRKAAAAEELREKSLSIENKEILIDARQEVGREMAARIRVWLDLLRTLVAAGVVNEKRITSVKGEIKLADEKLKTADLAGLQQHLENAGVGARRILDEVWDGKEKDRSQMLDQMAKQLSAQGFYVVEEEFGRAVRFVIPVSKKGKPRKHWTDPLTKLGKALKEVGRLELVVLASAGPSDQPPKAEKLSRNRAETAAEALVQAGVPRKRVHLAGCGATSPLVALRLGKERIAVLLVPLP
ncbi:MAG: hypothetical protein GY847_03725 [Proteobacteria bacterium]|nr:hypothetical protein [Pseudomonadota bacterium]